MIVKLFNRSKEEGSKPISYFLGNEKNREFARVLSGDPVVTEHLINATPYEHKYKSGVLSFTEIADEISEADKFKIMRDFEKTLFPGLEADQYDILWIEHSDKDIDANNPIGRLELNFLIPCQELRSGKRLQPYYAGADKARVNAWKNIINREIKTIGGEPLTDPNAPNRKRKVHNYIGAINRPSPYDIKPMRAKSKEDLDTSSRDALRDSINRHMLAMLGARSSGLDDQKAVVHELTTGLNLQIKNIANKSISVTHPLLLNKKGEPLRVRLEGGIYRKDFDAKDFKIEAQSNYEKNHARRGLRDDYILANTMQKKTEYHRELYKDAVAPTALEIDVKPVNTAETLHASTETPSVTDKEREVRVARRSLFR